MVLARTVRRHMVEAANDLAAADAFGTMGDGVIRDLVAVVGDNPLFGALEDCISGERRYRRAALCRIDRLSRGLWAVARGRRLGTGNTRQTGRDHNTSQLALPIGTDRTPRPNGFVRPWAIGATILGLGAAAGYWLAEGWARARNEFWPAANWDGIVERTISWGCGLALAAIALGSLAIAARRPSPRPSPRGRGGRVGFTLVELLVVTSVISTLAGIMLPGYASGREQARQTACMGNVRQLAIGLLQYADDHEGLLPPAYTITRSSRGIVLRSWQDSAGLKMLRCPSQSVSKSSHYGVNVALLPPTGRIDQPGGHSPMVADGNGTFRCLPRKPFEYALQPTGAHQDNGANLGYTDGHVRFIRRATEVM